MGCSISAWAAPHKLRVTDPALTQSMLAQGARLIADYGGFQLVEADDSIATNFISPKIEPEDDYNQIKLNAATLDTTTAEIRALRRPIGNFSGQRLHLVQFVGPARPEWRAALARRGARIVSYLPENAFLIYGDAPALGRVHDWAATNHWVQWDGEYAADYKIHPAARLVDAAGRPQTPPTDVFSIQMVDDPPANVATLTLIGQWQLDAIETEFILLGYRTVIVRLPPACLPALAARPDVVSIVNSFEPQKLDERQDQILSAHLSGNIPSGPGYLAWLASMGFTQAQFTNSNFVVDVSDSGIDNGTKTPGHFGLYPLGDSSQPSRVAYNVLQGRPNPGSTLEGCDGHGTLNSHIVAGYDNFTNAFPHTDSSGYSYGLGVCPFVKVGSSVIFDPNNYTSPNLTNLLTAAYTNGARISNNSWGSIGSGGIYDALAQSYDALVRDVGAGGLDRPMVVVFAAGNSGPGRKSVESPGSAKNVITVGAAENVRSLSIANGGADAAGDSGCSRDPDADATNANSIASFSSRGPCADGRMKPDLVAPGDHITGGVAQNSPPPSPSGDGSAISCFDATGVCGLPGSGTTGNPDNFFPLGQQFYTVSTGTSHSTPAVAGACALVRQFFINNGNAPPSPAMSKAYLMNSTRYLNGAGANDNLWSPSQGMGELDLGTAFDGASRILRDQLPMEIFTAAGQAWVYSGTVADPAKPFRVTLAWTDVPGSTAARKELVNSLNLSVTAGGSLYKGNVFSGGNSSVGGVSDSTNNVENVFLTAGQVTNFVVTVTAAQINGDAITNGGSLPEQDFALVIYNALVAQPTAQSLSVSNNLLTIAWNVPVNFNYRVQTISDLTQTNWTDLTANILATNSPVTVTMPVSQAQQFFRLYVQQ
ncbi:MAG: S8 family serine peptidase [Limisphaerales bacterium]